MRELIITGDDFGISPEVNDAIERAHRSGVLSSASLMIAAPAAADAIKRARSMPSLAVGLHVVTVCGAPALPADRLPAIVDAHGLLSSQLVAAGFNYFFNPAARRQLASEIRAQFAAFAATGLPLDHVDAHNHLHVHPVVFGLILDAGREFGMTAMRVPSEPLLPSWRASRDRFASRLYDSTVIAPWNALVRARLRAARISANDHVFGLLDTGRMDADRVLRLLDQLPDGVTEMYFHPGAPGSQAEEAALTDPRVARKIADAGVARITFGDLARRTRAA